MMHEDDLRALLETRAANPPEYPDRLAAVHRRATRIRRRRYAAAAVAALLAGAAVAGPALAHRHASAPAAPLQRTIGGLPEYVHGGRLAAHTLVPLAEDPARTTATLRVTVPAGGIFWGVGCFRNAVDYQIRVNGRPAEPGECLAGDSSVHAVEYPSWQRPAKLHALGVEPGTVATVTVQVRYTRNDQNEPLRPLPVGVWAFVPAAEYPSPPAAPAVRVDPDLTLRPLISRPLFTVRPERDGPAVTVTRTVTLTARLAVEFECGSAGVLQAAVNGTPVLEAPCWGAEGMTMLLIPLMAQRGLHLPAGRTIMVTVAAQWFLDPQWYIAVGPLGS